MTWRLLLVPIALFATLAQAQSEPVPEILRRALEAGPKLRYAGKRLVEFRRGGQITRHSETISRSGDLLRIEFEDGTALDGQVIVENGRERRHYFPDRNEILILPPRREEVIARLKGFARRSGRSLRLSTAAGETVAGLATEQVVVADAKGNILQRLYIEPKTGTLLKRRIFDRVGAPLGGFEFTQIDFSPRLQKNLFRLVRKGARVITPAARLEDLARRKGFLPIVLPPASGYRLEWSGVRKIEEQDVLIQGYTSKGSKLTLFQLKQEVSRERLQRYGRGELNFAYWQFRGRTFVLVGNLPSDRLVRIAGPISRGTAASGR